MLSRGAPRWELCAPPGLYRVHRSAPHKCNALKGTHGGIKRDPDRTRTGEVQMFAPHTDEPLMRCMEVCAGMSMCTLHARAIMAGSIKDLFAPPSRHLCPSWWGVYYISGYIRLHIFTLISGLQLLPWLLVGILGGSLGTHPYLLPIFSFKLNF